MQCNTTLLEGKVTLRREGMARSTESGETRSVLAHADVARKEARVVARTALEDTAYAGASRVGGGGGRGCGKGLYGYPRGRGVRRRAEERV
jgi:hypothetical protein